MSYTIINDIDQRLTAIQSTQGEIKDSACSYYSAIPRLRGFFNLNSYYQQGPFAFIKIVEQIRYAEGLPTLGDQVNIFNALDSNRIGDIIYIRNYLRALKKSSNYWNQNITNTLTQDISDVICLLTLGHSKDTSSLDPEDWVDYTEQERLLDFPPPYISYSEDGELSTTTLRLLEGGVELYPETSRYKVPTYLAHSMRRDYQALCKQHHRCLFRERFITRTLPDKHPDLSTPEEWARQPNGAVDPPFTDLPVVRIIADRSSDTQGNLYGAYGFKINIEVDATSYTGDYPAITFSHYFSTVIEPTFAGEEATMPEVEPEVTGIENAKLYLLVGYNVFLTARAGNFGIVEQTGIATARQEAFTIERSRNLIGDSLVPQSSTTVNIQIDGNGNKIVETLMPDDAEISVNRSVDNPRVNTVELVSDPVDPRELFT